MTAATAPQRPDVAGARSGWTGGRVAAAVIGALLALISVGLLGAGGTALWADLARRDAAGYVTTDVHQFSTSGSALATERIDLGSPGVDWLYSPLLLGEVRIRVTPVGAGRPLFVGVGPSTEVDRYLAGVGRTVISDFWTGGVRTIAGARPASAPGRQDLWVASATGPRPGPVVWDPSNGSWTVVVMNADGRPGVEAVETQLGATMPALLGVAVGLLVVGTLFLIGGTLLIVGAVRRAGRTGTP